MPRYFYNALAQAVQSRLNCIPSKKNQCFHIERKGDTCSECARWCKEHEQTITSLVKAHCNINTKLDLEASHADKLVFNTRFHHHDGWTYHTVTVTPSLGCDFHIRVSGKNRRHIHAYIQDEFTDTLRELDVPLPLDQLCIVGT